MNVHLAMSAIRNGFAAILLSLGLMTPAIAGSLEDAEAAYDRRDYATAITLLWPLVEKGDTSAQFTLGFMYMDGHGVKPDAATAFRLFQIAAVQGNARAQRMLGVLYAGGRGVKRDIVVAHMWFTLAVNRGDVLASEYRDQLEAVMTEDQLVEAERLARGWKQ